MSGFLLDTNVPSELFRPAPDPRVMAWSEQQDRSILFLSVVSMGEFHKGLTLLPQSARRSQLERMIDAHVPAWFSNRILPVTRPIAERWGVLSAHRQLMGRLLGAPEG